jgi:transposase InsO family protein
VERRFSHTEPNALCVTDINEYPIRIWKASCAVLLDLFSRRVVGWSIDGSDLEPGRQLAGDGDREPQAGSRRGDPLRSWMATGPLELSTGPNFIHTGPDIGRAVDIRS